MRGLRAKSPCMSLNNSFPGSGIGSVWHKIRKEGRKGPVVTAGNGKDSLAVLDKRTNVARMSFLCSRGFRGFRASPVEDLKPIHSHFPWAATLLQ